MTTSRMTWQPWAVAMIALLSTLAARAQHQLAIAEPTVEATQYTVPIVLQATPGQVAALNFQFRFDPAVFAVAAVEPGREALRAGKEVITNQPAPGVQIVLAMSLDGQGTLSSGEIARVVLEQISAPESGASELVLARTTLSTLEGNELEVATAGYVVQFERDDEAPDEDDPEPDKEPEAADDPEQEPRETPTDAEVQPRTRGLGPLEVSTAQPAPDGMTQADAVAEPATVDAQPGAEAPGNAPQPQRDEAPERSRPDTPTQQPSTPTRPHAPAADQPDARTTPNPPAPDLTPRETPSPEPVDAAPAGPEDTASGVDPRWIAVAVVVAVLAIAAMAIRVVRK